MCKQENLNSVSGILPSLFLKNIFLDILQYGFS